MLEFQSKIIQATNPFQSRYLLTKSWIPDVGETMQFQNKSSPRARIGSVTRAVWDNGLAIGKLSNTIFSVGWVSFHEHLLSINVYSSTSPLIILYKLNSWFKLMCVFTKNIQLPKPIQSSIIVLLNRCYIYHLYRQHTPTVCPYI